jgi:peptide/nickel transport system ATP-binding protein
MSLLSVSDLSTHYTNGVQFVRAVDDVSLEIESGETVALVGESGCGKSTLGKTLLRLVQPTKGTIAFKGEDISHQEGRALRATRRNIQMIFQDPFASLNPRHTIRDILSSPLKVHGVGDKLERTRLVEAMIDRVGLPREALERYPHEFSGGQRQRIGIARALILNPELVVCDEPVSALDLSIQAQILNLLAGMKQDFGLSYLFISHDLSVVRYFADRVLVMYLGRIVESADNSELWTRPLHPYTRALMDAVPDPSRRKQAAPITGDLPSPSNIPKGCRFHPRCPLATDLCRQEEPQFRAIKAGHQVACHFADAALPN